MSKDRCYTQSFLRAKDRLQMAGRLIALMGCALPLCALHVSAAAEQALSVAIQPDIPPYVMGKATRGFEVDLVRAALAGYAIQFTQMPYAELEQAVQKGWAEVALGVQQTDEGVSYSKEYLTFANYAISKKADGFTIDTVTDLKTHKVLTWQDAYLELGNEFKTLFSPGSVERKKYVEFADQQEQVRTFWQDEGDVIVIDRSIFRYSSREMGHSVSEVVFHALFPAVTNFKVRFKDAAVRDEFNRALARLCKSGEYAKLLERYDIELPRTVCEH